MAGGADGGAGDAAGAAGGTAGDAGGVAGVWTAGGELERAGASAGGVELVWPTTPVVTPQQSSATTATVPDRKDIPHSWRQS